MPIEILSSLFLLTYPTLRHYSRYLTAIDSSYYDSLSDASKKSLAFQGGPFKGEELKAFERHPLKDEMVRVRQWDDMSKVVGIVEQTPRAATYRTLIKKHLERHGS
jgi:2-amino-1-hydroxyethylphosphonate dioxygenase (glycine-forming)